MKKIVLGVVLMTISIFAYTILGHESDGEVYGKCNKGSVFSGNIDSSGYYIVWSNYGKGDSKSLDSAIRQACGE